MKELVFVNNNNEVVTDSLMVAEVFGRRHHDVIRSIVKIQNELEEIGDFEGIRNFSYTSYDDVQNKQKYNKYNLTKDGFTLLVMGFTGSEALKFKTMYIKEFNRMEESIKKQGSAPLKPIDQIRLLMANSLETEERLATVETNVEKLQNTMTIDYGQQVVLDNAKKKRVEYLWENLKVKGIHDTKRKLYAQFGKDLKRAFAVPSYRDISAKDFEEAMKFTKGWRPHLV